MSNRYVMIMIHSNNIDRTNVVYQNGQWELAEHGTEERRKVHAMFREGKLITCDTLRDYKEGRYKEWIIDDKIMYKKDLRCFMRMWANLTCHYDVEIWAMKGEKFSRDRDRKWRQIFEDDYLFEYVGEYDIFYIYRINNRTGDVIEYDTMDSYESPAYGHLGKELTDKVYNELYRRLSYLD